MLVFVTTVFRAIGTGSCVICSEYSRRRYRHSGIIIIIENLPLPWSRLHQTGSIGKVGETKVKSFEVDGIPVTSFSAACVNTNGNLPASVIWTESGLGRALNREFGVLEACLSSSKLAKDDFWGRQSQGHLVRPL